MSKRWETGGGFIPARMKTLTVIDQGISLWAIRAKAREFERLVAGIATFGNWSGDGGVDDNGTRGTADVRDPGHQSVELVLPEEAARQPSRANLR